MPASNLKSFTLKLLTRTYLRSVSFQNFINFYLRSFGSMLCLLWWFYCTWHQQKRSYYFSFTPRWSHLSSRSCKSLSKKKNHSVILLYLCARVPKKSRLFQTSPNWFPLCASVGTSSQSNIFILHIYKACFFYWGCIRKGDKRYFSRTADSFYETSHMNSPQLQNAQDTCTPSPSFFHVRTTLTVQ